jgi:hypothetical protein
MSAEVLSHNKVESSDSFLQLKLKYKSELATLKELFSSWSDDDLLASLQEVGGDLERAINRISEG